MEIYNQKKQEEDKDLKSKAVTGIGQTKRLLYTVDGDKIFEYKHCLMFNGINRAFSEPDILDRSIPIELSEIKPKYRRTEKEILEDFHKLKPKILKYIFDIYLIKSVDWLHTLDILPNHIFYCSSSLNSGSSPS